MYGLALAEHWIKNQQCALSYIPDIFWVLRKANTDYYLVLEPIYIKSYQPSPCKQKECLVILFYVYNIGLGLFIF